jgi:hypothetical protein
MLTTREVLDELRRRYPDARFTEDRLRHALRRGSITAPALVAGRYVWSPKEITALTRALGVPSTDASAASDDSLGPKSGRTAQPQDASSDRGSPS